MPLSRTISLFIWFACLMSIISVAHGARMANLTEIRVLWTYPTPITDFGFTFSLETARVEMEDKLSAMGIFLHSYFIQNVSIPDCPTIVTDLLLEGISGAPYDLWVAGGGQFGDCAGVIESDARFETMKILNISGGKTSDRISTATGSTQDGRYLHGILCAHASKTRVLGYVSSLPRSSSSVARGLAAFALGAWSIDPALRVVTGISGNFLDVVAERKATEILIKEANADCIGSNQNDLTVHTTADSFGAYSVGFASDARYYTSELVLDSLLFDWVPFLERFIGMIINDSWIPHVAYDWSLLQGGVKMSGYSTMVKSDWLEDVNKVQTEILNGTVFPFCTPYLRDPRWLLPNQTFELSPNVTCVKPENYTKLLDVISGIEVLVEFNTTHTPYEYLYVKWTFPGAIVLAVLSGLLIVGILASGVTMYWYRSSPVYRASSPLFLFIILFGVLVGAFSPFAWIGRRTNASCMLTWWFVGLGYGIVYSCLLAKNWRIWRIFASGHFKRVAILNAELIYKFLGVIMVLEITLISLWQALDPYVPKISSNNNLRYDQLQILCEPRSGKMYGIGVSLAFNSLVLLPVIFISYWTRQVKEEYRESKSIALIVYSNLIVFCVAFGVVTALPRNYLIPFYMIGYGTWIIMFTVWAALFLPKHWRAHFAASDSPASTDQVGLSTLQSEHGFESIMYTARDTQRIGHSRTVGGTQRHTDNPSLDSQNGH